MKEATLTAFKTLLGFGVFGVAESPVSGGLKVSLLVGVVFYLLGVKQAPLRFISVGSTCEDRQVEVKPQLNRGGPLQANK